MNRKVLFTYLQDLVQMLCKFTLVSQISILRGLFLHDINIEGFIAFGTNL